MDLARCGVILNTERYPDCVAFYRDVRGLEVMFAKDTADEQLTCFDLGGNRCAFRSEAEFAT